MAESLRDALERVMGLVEKAQSGDWTVETPVELPNEAIIRFSAGYVEFGGSRWGRETNAEAVAAAITLFQQHGPALLAAVRDGERLDFMLANGVRIGAIRGLYRAESSDKVLSDWCETPRAAVDAAMLESRQP